MKLYESSSPLHLTFMKLVIIRDIRVSFLVLCNSRFQSCFSSQSFWKAGSARKASHHVLEPLRQSHIPRPPLDISCRLIVAVFESARDERGRRVEDVVYAESNCRVIKPCPPTTRIVFCCRDRHNVLVRILLCPQVLAAVLGIAWDFA